MLFRPRVEAISPLTWLKQHLTKTLLVARQSAKHSWPSGTAATLQSVVSVEVWPSYAGLLLGILSARVMIGAFNQVSPSRASQLVAHAQKSRVIYQVVEHAECVQQNWGGWRGQQSVPYSYFDVSNHLLLSFVHRSLTLLTAKSAWSLVRVRCTVMSWRMRTLL